jgi:anti-sigma28 factor (negative regulator of flagellin synthesis)
MNVNEPKLSSAGSSTATARARLSDPYAEDFHLAELLRSLRSLAAESPERQAKIERLMRAYAAGDLQVDAEATASAIIDDAVVSRSRR